MIHDAIDRLAYLIEIIPPLLNDISDEDFSRKPSLDKWGKKEILGHLIDSASNNHHRFVRAQFEDNLTIVYAQDDWCKFNFYQSIEKQQIISFWLVYNKQLEALLRQMPSEALVRVVNDLTLDFLAEDYVNHLEYHLKQIVNY